MNGLSDELIKNISVTDIFFCEIRDSRRGILISTEPA
jgi:hypothetical protein